MGPQKNSSIWEDSSCGSLLNCPIEGFKFALERAEASSKLESKNSWAHLDIVACPRS